MYSNSDISSVIKQHFPFVTEKQLEEFERLPALYAEWNEKINVVSRKDIENIFERHILHSLAIAKVCSFKPNSEILDVGTGGGFPGIPLAILFPEVKFTLVDSIGKKIKVVNEVKDALGLKNVVAEQIRAEQVNKTFDFIISRAVTQMPEFVGWVKNKISKIQYHDLDNGLICLKGGDLTEELKPLIQGKGKKTKIKLYNIYDYFPSEFFETKMVVYVKL
ncbi:MAG: 16S rRNA (guanine(527)-N(7))-methyltransferase RsmG [Bacteroidales bacterium]|jgi:16S rRNA (guanine527-N7)-methyltransferase